MNRQHLVLNSLLILFSLEFWPLQATDNLGSPPTMTVPKLTAEPLVTADLNDPAWQTAARSEPFTFATDRHDDARARIPVGAQLNPTHVLVGWTPKALYVRFICEGTDIYSPMRGPEQNYYLADSVETFIDPKGDQRQWIEVIVSPENGVLHILHLYSAPTAPSNADGVISSGPDMWNIFGWAGLQDVKSATNRWKTADGKSGWLVDVAFPPTILQRLNQNRFQPMTLRANFVRNDYQFTADSPVTRKMVPSNWSPTLNSMPHYSPSRMGYLRLAPNSPPSP